MWKGSHSLHPYFWLGLGLDAEVAIGTSLLTEVFGFASGVRAYVRRRLIAYRLARSLLVATVPALSAFTVPGVIVGGQLGPVVASRISQHTLEKMLGVLFALVGALMLGKNMF